jgi:hypothetical protein
MKSFCWVVDLRVVLQGFLLRENDVSLGACENTLSDDEV